MHLIVRRIFQLYEVTHGKGVVRAWKNFQNSPCHWCHGEIAISWHSPFITDHSSVDPTHAPFYPASSKQVNEMIRKLKSGEYRLYSRKTDAKTGKRKNLGTFSSRAAAVKHEREVQYFKRQG
jgi:hypothetical protein